MNTVQVALVTFGANPEIGFAFPVEQLALVTALVANAKIVKPDNEYSAEPNWKPHDALPTIRVMDDMKLQPPSAEMLAAKKEAEENNTRWYSEYTRHEATKKALAEANAKVEALTAAGTCRAPAPIAPDTAEDA